jgi:cytidylate kinase
LTDPADGWQFEALLIGGRSGVGKSTVAREVSVRLAAAAVAHCVVEGDNLAEVHPAPPGDPSRSGLTAANLTAIWRNHADAGYRRLVYTNTVSVLDSRWVVDALGAPTRLVRVLLTATDETAAERLGQREQGSELEIHLKRSARAAARLDAEAEGDVVRIPTDGRTVTEIAAVVADSTGWLG